MREKTLIHYFDLFSRLGPVGTEFFQVINTEEMFRSFLGALKMHVAITQVCFVLENEKSCFISLVLLSSEDGQFALALTGCLGKNLKLVALEKTKQTSLLFSPPSVALL